MNPSIVHRTPKQVRRTAQHAVQARNHPDGESGQLIILATTHDHDLVARHAQRSCHVMRAFRTDNRRARLLRDVGHVEDMVVMSVCDQNEVRTVDVGVDGGGIRFGNVVVRDESSRIAGRRFVIRGDTSEPRQVRIDQYNGLAVVDLPAGCAQVSQVNR